MLSKLWANEEDEEVDKEIEIPLQECNEYQTPFTPLISKAQKKKNERKDSSSCFC